MLDTPLLERVVEVHYALQAMVVCTKWKRWLDSETEEAKKIRNIESNENWWTQAR